MTHFHTDSAPSGTALPDFEVHLAAGRPCGWNGIEACAKDRADGTLQLADVATHCAILLLCPTGVSGPAGPLSGAGYGIGDGHYIAAARAQPLHSGLSLIFRPEGRNASGELVVLGPGRSPWRPTRVFAWCRAFSAHDLKIGHPP